MNSGCKLFQNPMLFLRSTVNGQRSTNNDQRSTCIYGKLLSANRQLSSQLLNAVSIIFTRNRVVL